jgi:hypothetical protein
MQQTKWEPPAAGIAGCGAVGVLMAIASVTVVTDGLAIRGWFRTQLLQRPDIKIIRITEFRRLARKMRLLEVETVDGGLVVFSRWDLGTEPLDVLDALTDAGYAGPRKN